ncbi:MAG: WD40/YVTN/BNR-like repeat-containing protein [Anaerolineae bacterium]
MPPTTRTVAVDLVAAAWALSLAACGTTSGPATATATAAATEAPERRVEIPLNTPTPDPAWPTTYHALAYHPTNPDVMWFTFGTVILKSERRGAGDWAPDPATATGGPILYSLAIPRPDRFYAAGRSMFRVSADEGATWEPVADLGDAGVRGLAVEPGDEDSLYALVVDRGVLHSPDGGKTWTVLTQDIDAATFGLWPVRAEPLRLVTVRRTDMAVLASDDGSSWAPAAAEGLEGELSAVALAADGTAYAATSEGLFASADGGDTWSERGDRGRLMSVAVAPTDPQELTVIDTAGNVYRSTDGGRTW